MIEFKYDDGGRRAARGAGDTADCVVRAVAITTGRYYDDVWNDLKGVMQAHRDNRRDKAARYMKRCSASPGRGIHKAVFEPYLLSIGFRWHATMAIGTGCRVHCRTDELPMGRLILRLSKHVSACIDRVIHDTYNPARNGTRCVYGYWELLE